jgi:hypothetical protein
MTLADASASSDVHFAPDPAVAARAAFDRGADFDISSPT